MPSLSDHLVLARKLHETGKLGEAERCYGEILQEDAGQGTVWYLLGTVCYSLKKYEEAQGCFQERLGMSPDDALAWNYLGAVCMCRKEMDRAMECFHKAVALQPDLYLAYNNLGLAHRKLGHWDEAAGCFRKALLIQPEFREAQENLERILARQNSHAWVSSMPAGTFGRSAETLMEEALTRTREGKYGEAIVLMQQFLELEPTRAEAHGNLGVLLLKQGKTVEGALAFRRALSLWREFAEAHHHLGVALAKQGRLDEAIPSFHKALEVRPAFPEARFHLGRTLARQGRWEDAAACYREALRQRPKFLSALKHLGKAMMELGRPGDAAASYREILEHNPRHFAAHQHLCKACLYLGEIDRSLDHAEQSLGLQPNNPESRVNRSILWLLRGDYGRGLPEYEWRWQLKGYKPRTYPQPMVGRFPPGRTNDLPASGARLGGHAAIHPLRISAQKSRMPGGGGVAAGPRASARLGSRDRSVGRGRLDPAPI